YHAMICERYHQNRQSPFQVITELQQEQFSRLDPEVVHTFIESLANLTVGTSVKLSNHKTGVIVFTQSKEPTRPIIKLDGTGKMISLQDNPDLYIEDILT